MKLPTAQTPVGALPSAPGQPAAGPGAASQSLVPVGGAKPATGAPAGGARPAGGAKAPPSGGAKPAGGGGP